MKLVVKLVLGVSGLLALSGGPAHALTVHVSPAGSDGNHGTEAKPWRTLGKAAASVAPGDTVMVGGGVYHEVLRPVRGGSESAWIEFLAKPGETPIIDATPLRLASSQDGLVCFADNVAYLRLQGFEIRNVDDRTSPSRDPIGIAVRDQAHHIEVIDCVVHEISTHSDDRAPKGISIEGATHHITVRGGSIFNVSTSNSDGNAHGIAVYGERSTPVDSIIIDGVEMFNLTLGNSETLVFNGNVTNFSATKNVIHDADNIGIDIIGFEGVGPRGLDQARNGVIADNVVYNISTRNNPAYGEYSAAGIYVDGGRDLVVERNRVFNCDIGIELASEHPSGITNRVIVNDNVVWHNSMGGILLGGYDTRRGATEDCTIINNTFFENDTRRFEIGEVNIRHRTHNNVFVNNIFFAGAQGYLVTFPQEFSQSSGNTFEGNAYFSSGKSNGWEWQGRWASSWSSFKRVSGQETFGIFADPQFVEGADVGHGFALRATSPLIDRGLPQENLAQRLDAAGGPRLVGASIDIGAFEHGNDSPSTTQIAAIAIGDVPTARVLTLRPATAKLGIVEIQFSSDGQTWSPIANQTNSKWLLVDGVYIKAFQGFTQVVDSRSKPAGLYRAVSIDQQK